MLRLRCLACGLTVPYKGSAGDLCPRCLVRDEQAVALIPISDQPSFASGRTMGSLRIHTSLQGGRHTIAVRFPLREERTVESIVYQRHTIDWRGDQIVAMSPPQIPNPNMPPLPAPSLPMFPSCK